MTEEVENVAEAKRKPSIKNVMIEIYDNEGNIIERPKMGVNVKIISIFKKFDEEVFDLAQQHPNAVFTKI